jgi:DNA-binding NarL/FixJ family response regulator
MREITCIVLDDEKEARERLVILLSKVEGIKIIGIEGEPEKAIESITSKIPDLVFIDVEMPRLTGFDVVREVRKNNVNPDFIFVTGYNQYAIKAIKKEAFDYLLKPVDIDELNETINRYKSSIHTCLKEKKSKQTDVLSKFSEREIEIIKLIAEYKTSKQIAEKLYISKNTVDTHRRNILEKAGLHKTAELVVFARENGLM